MRTLATQSTRSVEDTQPALSITQDPDGLRVTLRGHWTADALSAPAAWQALEAQWQRARPTAEAAPDVVWDVRPAQRMDHTGAQALWNFWQRHWPKRLEAGPVQQALLDRVARFSVPPPPADRRDWHALLMALGRRLAGIQSHLGGLLRMTGQLLLDSVQLARHPLQGPWRDVSGHLYRIGATALPITALVGFLIGVVLAYLMSKQLRQYGADSFIVNILGMSLIRELGPVLAAILVAGRSGSAITAQIGVMRVTEELDAMRVMGIPKGFRLVMPRTLAMAVAMPLVAVWTTLAALLGGMLASDLSMGLTPAYFLSALPKTVEIANLWLALGKSCVFGVLIALIACHHGLRVKPDTQSLGEGTTASVVSSITMVILVDALFAVVFKSVGL
ncbi:ABC transporter permease [Rhodoferax sp.]|uniref:MlaE family ABC transporter permease n=1 Tax=Rhodoferax sp. TaxID=50421 RepID=UPI0025DFFBE9|nr:ABC transporter permease [Rhodoferax sp.]